MVWRIFVFLVIVILARIANAAFPDIRINSATGSDTLASGAGPSTAITGSTSLVSAAGLYVTLTNADFTGVSTNGDHALFLNDTTAGNKNFSAITNFYFSTTPTAAVAVVSAFGIVTNKTWAIGGKRQTLLTATSKKLIENNVAAGDALPGWMMTMESGHSETNGAASTCRRSGDIAIGPIIVRGDPTATTMPVLINGANVNGLVLANAISYWTFSDFEMRNTNATKTASTAIAAASANHAGLIIRGIKVDNATSNYWKGITVSTSGNVIEDCDIGYTANVGITLTATLVPVRYCWIHNCGVNGLTMTGNAGSSEIIKNIISNNTGDGINDARTTTTGTQAALILRGNTIDSNTSDGFETSMTSAQFNLVGALFENNIISNSGGYAFNFSGASVTEAQLLTYGVMFRNNNLYANSSNDSNLTLTSLTKSNNVSADPGFVSSGTFNYRIGTNLKALGYPFATSNNFIGFSTTLSYEDIGAAQRQEPTLGAASAQ